MRGLRRSSFWVTASFITVSIAIACGQEADIPDPVLPDGGRKVEAGDDGPTLVDTGINDSAVDAPDVVCPDVLPDDATGIYVAPTGTTSTSCGTRAAPCKTLTNAITRAVATTRASVYVARGTYVEKVALAPGIAIIGGWDVSNGTVWKRACVTPGEISVIRAPTAESVTVEARDLGGEASLTLLRIDSKPSAVVVASESLYGVVATGATTQLVMNDVHVVTTAGGSGAAGPLGNAGTAGGASCPAGTGTKGTGGAQGTGAPGGAFDPTGYDPGDAQLGGIGTGGESGTAGGLGTCVKCGVCDLALCTFTAVGAPVCGKDGVSGCGGGPGGPGGAGKGGGSSVGVYAWDATVTINGGTIKSGDAGNGGGGGPGGPGGAETKGTAGLPTDDCVIGCLMAAVCTEVKGRGNGGTAGGMGGTGVVGGAGGGGSGGTSVAIYQGGTGVVTTTASTSLGHGKAGTGGGPGGGAGTPGAATDRIP